MKRLLKSVQAFEETIIVVSFVVMVAATFTQVANRNSATAGISWLEEISRDCMIYMVLLATELGLRNGTQISVTAFTDKLPRHAGGCCSGLSRSRWSSRSPPRCSPPRFCCCRSRSPSAPIRRGSACRCTSLFRPAAQIRADRAGTDGAPNVSGI